MRPDPGTDGYYVLMKESLSTATAVAELMYPGTAVAKWSADNFQSSARYLPHYT
jgi:hypothetical protein